ncbi:aromatic-ring hydroxylase C-terminal domain-containing protein [Nocardia mikamii]|uniref:aromatic-ring hydroxylase C-terminal domain-containing protein n=1 Tax=Nocardia mikamii TaxID=508464 RepID=UPI0007A51B51|nr:hypothetical protein [Nocardia mikamii]
MGALIAGADIRYELPNPNGHALTGAFAPNLAPRTGEGSTALLQDARPVLLDLAGRPELRAAAREWKHRIEIRTAETADRPADALLIRPDAHTAWAATVGEPADTAESGLRAALRSWFGAPVEPGVPAGAVRP